MTARMADAAYLPAVTASSRDATILAGYVRSPGGAHTWTPADWSRARSWPNVGWLVPIYVYGRGQSDPAGAARDAASEARAIGAPPGCVLVLDVEAGDAGAAIASGFPRAWGEQLQRERFTPWVYTSASTARAASGWPLWAADWNNRPHMVAGAIATQWASPVSDPSLSMDLSDVLDPGVASLWSLRNPQEHPMPHLAAVTVAIVERPQNDGYWLVAADGGVFAFGKAPNVGSFGGKHLAAAIVDATCTPAGDGLYLLGADGGVLTLGHAGYHGSIPGSGIGPAPGTPGDPTP